MIQYSPVIFCAAPRDEICMNDDLLLAQAIKGNEAAFRQLYEAHRTVIFRFAYRLLQSVENAEEITHDCFLQLLKSPHKFDRTKASLRTYLCAIARNLSLKYLRDEKPENPFEQLEAAAQTPANFEPLFELLQEEIVAEVRKAIAVLPALQREAVILFEYEELSLAEIAIVVAADIGTVKSRLHRARENLRRSLAPYVDERPQAARCDKY